MGPGESIVAVVSVIAVFGGFFGGVGYIVHRVLSHRRAIKLAELEAQVRMTSPAAATGDELLRAVASELHTQRQMLESINRRLDALEGRPAPLTEPLTPADAPLRAPTPGLRA